MNIDASAALTRPNLISFVIELSFLSPPFFDPEWPNEATRLANCLHQSRWSVMCLHMRFAIALPIFGQYCDPRLLGELARDAENAGWDGCFIWDHIHVGNSEPVADPWIALATIALATERIRIGPMVTPLYRRYPWKLARESVSIDHLSGGRLILGVGLGGDWFGEISTFDGRLPIMNAPKCWMKGLEILLGLWSGDSFAFNGTHFRVENSFSY